MLAARTSPPAALEAPLNLAELVRVNDACRRALKLRTLAALRIENAKIRAENLQRDLPACSAR